MYHNFIDPDGSIDWELFFSQQTGSGGFRASNIYQRGSGSIGQLLGKLFMAAVPVLRRVGRAIGNEALFASSRVASDIAGGQNFVDSLRNHGNAGYHNLVDKAVEKLNQKGTGRKRRKTSSVKKRTKPRTPVKKPKRQSKPKQSSSRKRQVQTSRKRSVKKGTRSTKKPIFAGWPVS